MDVKERTNYHPSANFDDPTRWRWLFDGFSSVQGPINDVEMSGVHSEQFRQGPDGALRVADSFVFRGRKSVAHECHDLLRY